MSPAPRRSAARAKAEAADAEAAEAAATEEGEDEEEEKPKRDTTPLPSGEDLYNAKYVDGMTWQEIRDNLDPRIRSPKGLALIAEYVIEAELEEEHPEFSSLQELEGEELSAQIVEWHDSGQGWSVLAARSGLKVSEVQDMYADAGGANPGRVGGQRYGGGRSVGKAAEEEAESTNGDGGDEEEAEAPAPRRAKPAAAKKPAAKPAATAKKPATAAKKPAPRRKQPTPS